MQAADIYNFPNIFSHQGNKKSTLRLHIALVRMAKIKKKDNK